MPKMILNAPAHTCACGKRFETVKGVIAHVKAGHCPRQGPEDGSASLTVSWMQGIGRAFMMEPKTEAERERRAQAIERVKELRTNPEYQANAAAKRERKRLIRLKEKAILSGHKTIGKTEGASEATPNLPANHREKIMNASETTVDSGTKSEKATEKKGRQPRATDALPVGKSVAKIYKGDTYTVTATKEGFEVRKNDNTTIKTFTSLSAAAKDICNTTKPMSGQAFFKLWAAKDAEPVKPASSPEVAQERAEAAAADAADAAAPAPAKKEPKAKKAKKAKGSKKEKKAKAEPKAEAKPEEKK